MSGRGEQSRPSEKEVAAIWRRRLLGGVPLSTVRGEAVEVLYPGRANDGSGADYRDAVLATGGRTLKGDIEVHVSSRDWRTHGHHQDRDYDRVVLHVVWHHDGGVITRRGDGVGVPVVALEKQAGALADPGPAALPASPAPGLGRGWRCRWAMAGGDEVARRLDRAGDERFLAKAAAFRQEMGRLGSGQCLYRGIMGALGYSRNKALFLEIADRLPLSALEAVTGGRSTDDECLARLQALLLGERGMAADDAWRLFRVRPQNSPARRLAAMAHLCVRFRRVGLLPGLVRLVKGALSGRERRQLEGGLVVKAAARAGGTTLLGRDRAAIIVVNVLLPFFYAWAGGNESREMAARALAVYRGYPRLAGNALERHMEAQLGLGRPVGSARRQQGLIHIYRTLCVQGRCGSCSAGEGGGAVSSA